MDSLKQFVLQHMEATINEDRSLNRDAAYESAKQDERWAQFQEHLERMGWMEASTKLLKRIARTISDEVQDPQDEFPFIPQILILDPAGAEVRFRSDVNREQFIKAMEVRKKNHAAVGEALKQMQDLFDMLDMTWASSPEMLFKEVVLMHKAALLSAIISRRSA